MGWLQDFVPNHMAFSPLNPWIYDVLEKGRYSSFDRFFDKQSKTPLMLPVLSAPLEAALKNKEVTVIIAGAKLQLRHGGLDYPLNAAAYSVLLSEAPTHSPLRNVYHQAIELTDQDEHAGYEQQWQQLLLAFYMR